jgi:hypothetical protein
VSSCQLNKTVRPWERVVGVEMQNNSFVIGFVVERTLHLAVLPAGNEADDRKCTSDPETAFSGRDAAIYPLMELESEDATVRFCSTPTAAIVFSRGKMNIFDFFSPRKAKSC